MGAQTFSIAHGAYAVTLDGADVTVANFGDRIKFSGMVQESFVYWLAVELLQTREKLAAALAAAPAEPPAEQWGPWRVIGHPLGQPKFRVSRRSLTDPKRWDSFIDPRRNLPALFPSRSDAWGWILAQGMSQKESISPTGRSPSPGPNMQSMPLHTDEAARVRAAFKKEPTA